MSDNVKLAAKLPANPETNGLDAIAADLLASFDAENNARCAIVWYDVEKVAEKRDHTRVPYIAVRRIEDLGELGSVPKAVVDAALAAQEARTGATPIDFATVDADAPQVDE